MFLQYFKTWRRHTGTEKKLDYSRPSDYTIHTTESTEVIVDCHECAGFFECYKAFSLEISIMYYYAALPKWWDEGLSITCAMQVKVRENFTMSTSISSYVLFWNSDRKNSSREEIKLGSGSPRRILCYTAYKAPFWLLSLQLNSSTAGVWIHIVPDALVGFLHLV